MASYSEIQKLEQRHRENPDGRTFAPLADAYRRAGRLEEAHQLVQAGLLKHPEYVSAHIVLGRCLIDMGDTAGARVAFEQVYALDSENIIALRTLSELAEGESRFADAEYWLRQALDVDPMNPDIRDALERIAAQRPAEPEPAIAPSAPADVRDEPALVPRDDEPGPEAVSDDALAEEFEAALAEPEPPREDLVLERAAPDAPDEEEAGPPEPVMDLEVVQAGEEWSGGDVEAEPEAPEPEAPPIAEIEIERASEEATPRGSEPWMPVGIDAGSIVPFDGRIDFGQVEEQASPPLDIEPDQQDVLELDEADVAPVEGLAATQFDSMMPAAEPPAATDEPVDAAALFDVSEESVSRVEPAADEDEFPDEVQEAVEAELGDLLGEAEETVRGRADSALADLPVFIPEDDEAEAADVQSAVEDDYQAADHEALEEAEPVVTETMAELLVAQGHVEEAIRVYRALLEARPGDPMLERRLATLEGRPGAGAGQTVGQLFRGLLAAEITLPDASRVAPAPAPADAPVSPEAASGGPPGPLSLDEVFGGAERGGSEGSTAPAPAEPEAGPAARPQDPDEFSFDAFFGGETAPPEAMSEPDGDPESDLDEFQAWLRGLKS